MWQLHTVRKTLTTDAQTQSRHVYRSLSQAGWTTATAFSTWSALLACKLSSPSLMQRLADASSWESGNTTALLQPNATTSIGCWSGSVYLTIMHQLSVPGVRHSTFGSGPMHLSVARSRDWNPLPDHLWNPAVDPKQFRQDVKTYLFAGHLKC